MAGRGFFGGGCFGFWFNYNREVHPFEDGAFSSVALALVQTNDSSVTTVAFFLRGSNFVEQNFYRVLLMKTRDGKTPIMDSAALAERDHLLSHGPSGFRLGNGGDDALVLDETANQVSEHGVAVLAGAA